MYVFCVLYMFSFEALMTWRGSAKSSGIKSSWDVCKPGGQLQETSDLCDCQQVVAQVMFWRGEIHLSLIQMQIKL